MQARLNIAELTRKHIMAIATAISAISIIVGGALAVEGRYAKAEELLSLKKDTRIILLLNRKQNIEDKLFELRLKSPSPLANDAAATAQRALIKRFEDQLREITSKLSNLEQ